MKVVSLLDDAAAGACAGVVSRMVAAPLDVVKIRFQLQFQEGTRYRSIWQALYRIYRDEGILSLWKGNLSASYLWIGYFSAQFSIYGSLKRFGLEIADPFVQDPGSTMQGQRLCKRSPLWNGFILFVAGAGAGTGATILTYPLDIMRTQFAIQGQKRTYTSLLSFVSNMFVSRGLRGFYSGLSAAVVGIAPYMGLNFAIYESSKIMLERMLQSETNVLGVHWDWAPQSIAKEKIEKQIDPQKQKVWHKSICGALAGGVSKLIVFPLDTMKKRLQAQVLVSTMDGAGSLPAYKGLVHCARRILREEGLAGWYKGLTPTLAKAVVATSVSFTTYEVLRDIFHAQRSASENNNNNS